MARIGDVFLKRISALQAYAASVAAAFRGQGPGAWAVPPITLPLTDPKSLTEPYDRGEINTDYSETLKLGGGKLGDVIGLHRQIGFVAMEERAARLRYMAPSRAIAHAYGRLDGHASDNGVFGKTKTAAENMLKAGGAKDMSAGGGG